MSAPDAQLGSADRYEGGVRVFGLSEVVDTPLKAVLFATAPTIVHGFGNHLPVRSEWLGIVSAEPGWFVGESGSILWLLLDMGSVGVCHIAKLGDAGPIVSARRTLQGSSAPTWVAFVGVGSAPWSDRGTRPVFPPGQPMPPFAGVREPRRPLRPPPSDAIALDLPA